MKTFVERLYSQKKFLFAGLAWWVLFILPWGAWIGMVDNAYLAFFIDLLRLGLALVLFIIPGAMLYLLMKKNVDAGFWLGLIPIGFAFSVTLIELFGLLGRVVGFSFFMARGLFVLAGAAMFVLVTQSRLGLGWKQEQIAGTILSAFQNRQLVLALILAFFLTLHDYLFFIDDTTYGAYLTNWQYSTQLGFMNIVHNTQTLEISRFWLAMFPISQSLLAAVSGIPGLLLLGNYLELLLVPLAVITLFWFTQTLGLSQRVAGFVALIQVALYAWMQGNQWPAGTWFFQSISEDKVAAVFFFAPVFFFLALEFLQRPSGRALTLTVFCGLGVTLTHPVILFLVCAITAQLALFAWISKRTTWRIILALGLVLFILMLPYAAIRLADRSGDVAGPYDGKEAATSFQIERYTNVVSDLFYGLNPGVLEFVDFQLEGKAQVAYQWFRMIPIYLLVLAGILSLIRLKQGPVYWYLAASILLVTFAAVPYTGWLLGYFVSARLISRTSWFFPVGLSTILLLLHVRDWLASRNFSVQRISSSPSRWSFWLTALIFIFSSPFLVFTVVRIPNYFHWLDQNLQRARIGTYIDEHADGPVTVIALEYVDILLIPTMSADARLISFREELDYNGFNNLMSLEQIRTNIAASNTIRSMKSDVSTRERCEQIHSHQVSYVMAPLAKAEEYLFLLGDCASSANSALLTQDYVLFEFR